ncbi:MAG TPA: branched-chain amino acid ABC transporter permease [Ktedonobacterales bacterium]|nr:branched-chain amino acid ABC transporter permease [Ktedonobacterales bacterium]
MNPILSYLMTLVVFFFIYNILTWGLNIQFGAAGILNFAYIAFMAIGAYIAGTFALTKADGFSGQTYVFGFSLPFPIPILAGGLVSAAVGLLVGVVALKRLRSDYMAIVTISVGAILYDIIGNYFPLFNGWDGLGAVPAPLENTLQNNFGVDYNEYQWVFLIITGVIMALMFLLIQRIIHSPFGRTLRAIREDQDVSEAFGKDTFWYRMVAMAIGCFYAGVGGALLIEYVSAFNPSGWTTGETFVLFAALIIGGRGNNWGAALGALLVPIIFQEATRYLQATTLSQIPNGDTLIPALRNIIVGALLIGTLWFRPQGLIPERKATFPQMALDEPENKEEEADVAVG